MARLRQPKQGKGDDCSVPHVAGGTTAGVGFRGRPRRGDLGEASKVMLASWEVRILGGPVSENQTPACLHEAGNVSDSRK